MLIFILFCFLFIVVVLAALRYCAFVLSNGIGGQLNEIRSHVQTLDRAIARGFLTAIAADLLVLPASLLALLPDTPAKPTSSRPILLVHGLYHNKTAWLFLKYHLKKAGFTDLHTYQYNSFTKDFDNALEGMEQRMDQLIGNDPDRKIILIGHSLGGLVSRCTAGKPELRSKVAGLITLGSPHGGSDLAWLGGNKMARDLIPGRAISQAVEKTPDPDCPRLGIYTMTDDFVFPLRTLRTGRPGWEERICAPMAHVWMLVDTGVARMITTFLEALSRRQDVYHP